MNTTYGYRCTGTRLSTLSYIWVITGFFSLSAIKRDGCNVKGYMAWSLMDNLEWTSAYTQKFGIYRVNFTDPDRTRTPKKSAAFYHRLVTENIIPPAV